MQGIVGPLVGLEDGIAIDEIGDLCNTSKLFHDAFGANLIYEHVGRHVNVTWTR